MNEPRPLRLDRDGLRSEICPCYFEKWRNTYGPEKGYEDLVLIGAEGAVLCNAGNASEAEPSASVAVSEKSGPGRVWKRIKSTKKAAIDDFNHCEPTGAIAAFAGAPVFDSDKELQGAVVARLSPNTIIEHLNQARANVGAGDIYLVGQHIVLAASSTASEKGAGAHPTLDDQTLKRLREARLSAAAITADLSGQEVFRKCESLGLKSKKSFGASFDWVIVSEMGMAEALRPASIIRTNVILTVIFLALLAVVVAYFFARSVARPITEISEQVKQVRKGDLTGQVRKTRRQDELGVLMHGFQEMVDNLRGSLSELLQGIHIISESAGEILAAVSQAASSATRTSAALTQATTTVEEVKQAAKVSSDKAERVSTSSKNAVQVSASGRQATEDTMNMMRLIEEQMQSVGSTVENLKDKTTAIQGIISAVQDIANQSNLLAVNASIEAARAGETGRGFAVVAYEIKSLSDQSSNATQQVAKILGDIQESVAQAVTTTEQSAKAVQDGVEQSVLAGEAIQALTKSIEASSEAASVIDASSEQQFVGVEQVASAMSSIEESMRQNLQNTKHLEASARRLDDLGKALKHLVEQYRI